MRQVDLEKIVFDANGLIPCVVQDQQNRNVLMVGFMSKASLQQTIDTGLATFFSRSRSEIWVKGETSGNYLKVVSLAMDCDSDTVLATVNPKGPACHTGTESCFQEPG